MYSKDIEILRQKVIITDGRGGAAAGLKGDLVDSVEFVKNKNRLERFLNFINFKKIKPYSISKVSHPSVKTKALLAFFNK